MGRSAPFAPSSWHPSLQSVQLNQDCSCVSAGGPTGFSIVELRAFRRHAFPLGGGIRVCQMLDCSSLVAIVGGENFDLANVVGCVPLLRHECLNHLLQVPTLLSDVGRCDVRIISASTKATSTTRHTQARHAH